MPCCRVDRRDVLRWSAMLAAASPLLVLESTGAAASAGPDAVAAVDLELVTLTETSAVLTWYTGVPGTQDDVGRMHPARVEGEVVYGTHPQRLRHRVAGRRRTAYHYVELEGLEPGQTYYYQARSRGRNASPTPFTLTAGNPVGTSDSGLGTGGPYAFTTPRPPRGRFLFSIALCNDLHLGETVAGLVGGLDIPGISQVPGLPPYPEVMAEALVSDARARGAHYLLGAGDISAEAEPADLARARAILDGFGRHRRDYFIARGNHDRAHAGTPYATCTPGRWQGNDCFGDAFAGDRAPGGGAPTWFGTDLGGLRVLGLDTYDKPGNGGDAGELSGEQLAWFTGQLADEPDRPTLVFGHHPLSVSDSVFPVTAGSALRADQATAILERYARTPGVFLHHAGHTHRNHRSVSPLAPAVTLQEVAAGKEYPGGFCLLRIHTGGYALNFYKTRHPLARAWSERSRQQIFGLWPQFALGTRIADRNSVTDHDLSGLRPRRHAHGHHHR